MEFIDLALREGDDPAARKADPLEDMGDVFLVAGQAVEGFGDNDAKPALYRILQKFLDAGPDQARARYAAVAVLFINSPAFLCGALAADPDLVLDRSLPLQIGRIAGIDSGGAHFESFSPPVGRGARRSLLRRSA
jgi:hypothetical protein